MAKITWIKIAIDMFDDEKLKIIDSMPERDLITNIWIRLICLAGKTNDQGKIYLTEKIMYTADNLSAIFNRPLNSVKLALGVLSELEMITLEDNGCIYINNWEKHQNIEGMEKIKLQNRARKQKQREREKQAAELLALETQEAEEKEEVAEELEAETAEDVTSRDCHVTVTQQNKNKNKNKNNNNISCDKKSENISPEEVEQIKTAWNNLGGKVRKLTSIKDKRLRHLNARVKEHGLDTVLDNINNIKKSKFLLGYTKDWFIKFDWFIKPSNFNNVLEGNYQDIETIYVTLDEEREKAQKKYIERKLKNSDFMPKTN